MTVQTAAVGARCFALSRNAEMELYGLETHLTTHSMRGHIRKRDDRSWAVVRGS